MRTVCDCESWRHGDGQNFSTTQLKQIFEDDDNFAGQRFAARRVNDPKGQLTLRETILAKGEASQKNTLRWKDYATTAMDPTDDCTFWYVGDYLKEADVVYRSRIGAFRLPNCQNTR